MIICDSYVSFVVGATDLDRYGAAASYQQGSSHRLIQSRLVSEAKSSFVLPSAEHYAFLISQLALLARPNVFSVLTI